LAQPAAGEAGGADWSAAAGPFRFARAEPRKGAIVDTWIDWNTSTASTAPVDRTPYIVRAGYGLGSVTWVAHDLGDPSITSKARSGWTHVWDHIFDLKNNTTTVDTNLPTEEQARYRDPFDVQSYVDVGPSLNRGMELQAKTRSLVTLAVLFFVAYWLIAGPGLYIYLLSKSRSNLSWFVFAASAVVATLLTVLLVRLVVRGAPELHHVTIVRKAGDQPAIMLSRFGLYVPRDGAQEIALRDLSPGSISYITPFPAHPQHINADEGFTANLSYDVPVHDASEADARINVPYRRTLKKLQARWVGAMHGGVDGQPKIDSSEGQDALQGVLTNSTGQKLVNIYFAYNDAARDQDVVLYLPSWDKGISIDLAAEFDNNVKFVRSPEDPSTNFNGIPENGVKLRGYISNRETYWQLYWYYDFKNTSFVGNYNIDDSDKTVKRSFPVMSLFDRLPPSRNPKRFELLRRGGRQLDCSPAVAAGQLVVLAEADGEVPLPYPLDVAGERVAGKGAVFYQFILGMDRVSADASTQPATQPIVKAEPQPKH
jgi:hypothetical protein